MAALCLALPAPIVSGNPKSKIQNPKSPPLVSFINDVVPVLTKVGCNAGACHGSQYGKGGFKLSLLGYDPDFDYLSIRKEARARRVTAARPERNRKVRESLHGRAAAVARGAE